MIKWVLEKVLGTHNARQLKGLWPVVERVKTLEPQIQALSDDALRAKTEEFRARLAKALAGEQLVTPNSPDWYELEFEDRLQLKRHRRAVQQRALEPLIPEAFAVVREAARRRLNMRHFDTQLVGGLALHEGTIAEMATGEGKTLVATLPVYLNALTGRGVHVVTVNDYLARRDARWMGPVYHALGLTVGIIQGVDPVERRLGDQPLSFIYDPAWTQGPERFHFLRPVSRRDAYHADITYGQNNEFGFDYLRDNMRVRLEELVQREFHFAIVDEVDSILIDEARTPLIISGPAEESTELYYRLDKIVARLSKGADFELDEKQRAVSLTEAGIQRCEELLGVGNLYDELNMRLVHHVHQALRAHELFKRDVDYMVKDGEILIVDEFTGRLMPGRRWSDGLHQAIEAKEDVRIREENQTLASVTFQNYFRMYEKLAGMTGTASTEAQEFREIYKLDVTTIPTNMPMRRSTSPDVVYKTEAEKFLVVTQEIVELHRKGRPVLVGTLSIEKSERLSRMLTEPGPLVKRLATVCGWMAEELKKEALPGPLAQQLAVLAERPAMLTEAAVEPLLEPVKAAAPKSILVYRLDELVRLAQTLAAVKAGVPHNVLNAKFHEQESRIVAQAGRLGAVTIATNMAGRGTDILLGGNPQFLAEDAIREAASHAAGGTSSVGSPAAADTSSPERILPARSQELSEAERAAMIEQYHRQAEAERATVVELGGLHMLGTERHEARRIDNQLRGRAGRQGDPGSSRFYLSLQDDLMRIFGSERIARLMDFKWFQWEEGLPIEHPLVTRSIETAQRRVEGENFEARKHLLEYDNVMNRQREVIYEQRRRILEGVDLQRFIDEVVADVADELVSRHAPREARAEEWDMDGLRAGLAREFGISAALEAALDREGLARQLEALLHQAYEDKEQALSGPVMRQLERNVLLAVVDAKWKDHLYMMDALREGIHLRAYGQRDPLVEYQHEAYAMFEGLVAAMKVESLMLLLRIQPKPEAQPVSVFATTPQKEVHEDLSVRSGAERFASKPLLPVSDDEPSLIPAPKGVPRATPQARAREAAGTPKVGRNDPCPCGSGLKYKKCHGK